MSKAKPHNDGMNCLSLGPYMAISENGLLTNSPHKQCIQKYRVYCVNLCGAVTLLTGILLHLLTGI